MRGVPEHIYPFSGRWHETRGLRMHFLDEGPRDGPPVLMLHGNPTWSIYYRNLIPALSDHYRCIVPDHIGCGLSDKPDDAHYDYRLASRIEDLDSLVAALDLDQPLTLVVHDWGGLIGLAWARHHAALIDKLVITNTAAFPMLKFKRLPTTLALARNTTLGAILVRGMNAFALGATFMATAKPLPRSVRKAYTAPYDSWANRIATLRFVQDIPLSESDPGFDILLDTAEHLHLFRDKPCLIAWGERDFVFDIHFLNEWRKHLPEAEILRFPNCGHFLLEDAASVLPEKIRKFIDIRDESKHGHNSE